MYQFFGIVSYKLIGSASITRISIIKIESFTLTNFLLIGHMRPSVVWLSDGSKVTRSGVLEQAFDDEQSSRHFFLPDWLHIQIFGLCVLCWLASIYAHPLSLLTHMFLRDYVRYVL